MIKIKLSCDGKDAKAWIEEQLKEVDHYGEYTDIFIPNVTDVTINDAENLIIRIGKNKVYLPMIFSNGISITTK